jgi:oligopeptide/dipeptide ABC transporter ATP-binding protein
LIADEPTTALDVTVQAQILNLMQELQDDFGSSIVMITHNLGVVSQMADYVAVMYLGKVVEYGTVRQIFHNPLHPYTMGLLQSVPVFGKKRDSLVPIEGMVPSPTEDIRGCAFAPRCPMAGRVLKEKGIDTSEMAPTLQEVEPGHWVSCWLYGV